MKLVVLVLNKLDCLEAALEAYVEAGVSGATILDSEGMGRFLAFEVPLFADFKDLMKGDARGNKTILAVVRGEAILEKLKKLVGEAVGGLGNPGNGIMFTVPVDWCSGLLRPEEEA